MNDKVRPNRIGFGQPLTGKHRKLKVFVTSILLALFARWTVCAPQQANAESARKELEAALNQRSQALERDDNASLLSFYSPSFKIRLGGNKVLTLQDLSKGPSIESKSQRQHRSSIQSFKWNGAVAVLVVRHTDSVKQTLDDGSVREAFSVIEQREAWIPTSQGWKLELIDNLKVKESRTLQDGKKISSSNLPIVGGKVIPNSVDESVLREGYGIVFIYRLNDQTIVKSQVYCDDAKVARLTGGSFIKVKLLPGKHLLRSEKGNPVEVDIAAGKIVMLALKLDVGFPKARGVLSLDNTSLGASAYRLPRMLDLNPLGLDNVDDASRIINH